MKLYRERTNATNFTLIDVEELPLKELCIAEALYEEMEKVKGYGPENPITVTREKINAKYKEKMREKRKTGKVSTSVPFGTFGIS